VFNDYPNLFHLEDLMNHLQKLRDFEIVQILEVHLNIYLSHRGLDKLFFQNGLEVNHVIVILV
jgi:hypothetical protein